MELQGRIKKVLAESSGISQRNGNQWRKKEYLFGYFEFPSDIYERHIVLSIMNDRIEQLNLQEGDEIKVRVRMDAHENNGRYFNEILTGVIDVLKKANQPQPAPTQNEGTGIAPKESQPTTQENKAEEADDLPF